MLRDVLPILLPIAAAVGAAAGGIVSWALRIWWENKVNSAAQRTLAEFKHQLDGAAASATFDYQRRLHDFSLFVAKKHEALAQLHELLLDAMSKVVIFARGGHDRAVLLDRNVDDASDYLEFDARIPRGKRSEILALWDTDRDQAVELLYAYQDEMQGEHARRAWVKANNYRLGCDLYLPEEISQAAGTITGCLSRLLLQTQLEKPGSYPVTVAAGEVERLFSELKSQMRAEMARSEFS